MKSILLKDGSRKEFHGMEMMGIINVTPDSFFAGSRTIEHDAAVARAEALIAEGATFIDIGGESTRPGSLPVTIEEEIHRVCPVIASLKESHPEILLSVDTYNAETAAAAIEAGVDIINDISGLTFDDQMASVAAAAKVPVIIMHTGGRPDVMQNDPHYDDVVEEVYEYLERQINYAVSEGIDRESIIIDLGIGFGKTVEHNLELLRNIDRFDALGVPHLLAVSRKSFIGKLLEENDPADRLFGTVAVTLFAERHGIELARVHDVKANYDAVRMQQLLTARKTPVIIALGSNMGGNEDATSDATSDAPSDAPASAGQNGGSRAKIQAAIDAIEQRVGHITALSSIIETKPYGNPDQPDFLNMALKAETSLTPQETLQELLAIEESLGRVRTEHWGPRVIDLDMIYFGDQIIDDADLKIPHPDLHNRDFVLGPISEFAADFRDPLRNRTIAELLADLRAR